MSPAASRGPKEDSDFVTHSRESKDREMTGTCKINRLWSPAFGRGFPRLVLQTIVLLSHMYSTESLSELRHQLTDTSVNTTSESSGSQWGEYGSWSSCSSSCGYGIRYQDRSCLNPRNEFVDARFCLGSDRRYKICKTDITQSCRSYRGSRAQMCSEFTEFGVHWQPYPIPSAGACEVACCATYKSRRICRILEQRLPDGTPCARYSGCDWWVQAGQSTGVCLQGQCSNVGCDGIVNSTMSLDACGVCGGDGSSCRVVSGKFSELQQDLYAEVVEIPAGAFNIRVYEVEKTSHHLAIKDETGAPILNSIVKISQPGRYEVAGTTAVYKRCGTSGFSPGHYEEISIPGTTTDKIIILIVYTQKYSWANVAYRYSILLPSPETLPTTVMLVASTTSDIPDIIDSTTSLNHGEDSSTGTLSVEPGNQDLQNEVTVSGIQGTNEQLLNATDFTEPATEGKAESSLEIQNVSREFNQAVATTTSEGLYEKFLPHSQNSSLLQEELTNPVGMSAETPEKVLREKNVSHENEKDILPGFETSGHVDEDQGETTLEPTSLYSSTSSNLFENSSQVISDTTESPFPLDSEELASSTVASTALSSSFTNGQVGSFENNTVGADNFYTAEESRTSKPQSVTQLPTIQTGRTVTVEDLEDFQDSPLEYRPVIPDSQELLFGEVPQIMALNKPSVESPEPAVNPSVSGATAVVIFRSDVPEDERIIKPRYFWARTGVAPCSATCTRGMSRSYAYCTLNGEQVSDKLCDPASKPEVVEKGCGGKPCETRWAVGSWSQCTVSCGTGTMYRTVHCWLMIAPGLDTSISNSYCSKSKEPESVRSCSLTPCGPQWQTSDWSECSVQCGEGLQTREVRCSVEDTTLCNPSIKPSATKRCSLPACPSQWTSSQWTQCRNPCSIQNRRVDCVNPRGIIVRDNTCATDSKPLSHRLCGESCPAQWVAQSYGPCRGECGFTSRQRQVVCGATSSSGHMQVLADSVCNPLQKPSTETGCQLVSCQHRRGTRRRRQTPQWLTTRWSVCSVTCGTGQRTREVTCNRKRNQLHLDCNASKKPISTETCSLAECPVADPNCSDSPSADCNLIRRANLCRYDSYKRSCCVSCSP